jgi:hypothetical protein
MKCWYEPQIRFKPVRKSLEELSRLRFGEESGVGKGPFIEGALEDVDLGLTVGEVNVDSIAHSLAVWSRVEDVAHLFSIAERCVSYLVSNTSSLVGQSN